MPRASNGRTVLFIDDEPLPARNYIDTLTDWGYKVVPQHRADVGGSYLNDSNNTLDVVILDMQMPTPQGVSSTDTDDGQTTGIWVLLQCRTEIERRRIPVFVFTNRQRKAVVEQINERVAPLDWTLVVKTKTEVSARDLPGEIDKLF